MKNKNLKSGFTLLEILLVVGIIAILAGIVIVAINPSKQLATVRNAERKSDIKQIDSAITQYYIDNFEYPDSITGTLTGICNTGSLSTTTDSEIVCTNLIDLTVLVPDYITAIPYDPSATTTDTGYYVKEDATTHKIGVRAELAELDQDIVIGMAASTTPPGEGGDDELGITGLVAHYLMNTDSTGTNVVDTTGDYDGTSANTISLVDSKNTGMGKAMSFNGSSDYVEVGNATALNVTSDFTLSVWVSFSSLSGSWKRFISKWDGGAGYILYYNTGLLSLYTTAGNFEASFTPSTSVWYHFAATKNSSGNITLYVNGSSIGSGSLGNATVTTAPLRFSASENLTDKLNGSLDDVRIYNRALTSGEVAQIYNDGDGTEAE